MGDWTGTVPTILAGDVPTGDDWKNVLDELSAISTAWTSWTPTLTNITQGNGTISSVYRRVGKTVDYDFLFTLGSTSAMGTNPKFSLPATPHSRFTAVNYNTRLGSGMLLDSSGGVSRDVIGFWATNGLEVYHFNATPTHAGITATVPWAWATSDTMHVFGTFETA